jgi:hypothetical protein
MVYQSQQGCLGWQPWTPLLITSTNPGASESRRRSPGPSCCGEVTGKGELSRTCGRTWGNHQGLVMGDSQNGWFIENPKIKSNGWMINGVPPWLRKPPFCGKDLWLFMEKTCMWQESPKRFCGFDSSPLFWGTLGIQIISISDEILRPIPSDVIQTPNHTGIEWDWIPG